jgi:O-antigen/teichoic acid export membrane protein
MNIETAEHFDACNDAPRSALVSFTARTRAMAQRFPLVKHGLLSLIDQAIASATTFATMVIIGRATSPNDLGLYSLAMSIVFIAIGIHEQIVAAPYTVYSKRHHGEALERYTGSVWFHHLAVTALGSAFLLIVIAALAVAGAEQILPGMWSLLMAGPFMLLREWIRRFTYANLNIIPALLLDALVAVVQLGGLLLLWHFERMTIFSIFGVMSTACAIACLGWYLLAKPSAKFDSTHYWSDWTQNWSFGRWAVRSYFVASTIPFVMPWILGLSVGMSAVGVLAACNTVVNIANLFLISMDRVLVPRAAQSFAHGGRSELRRVLSAAALVILPVLGAFCVLAYLFGDQLAVFVFGMQFEGHGGILTTLALVTLTNGVAVIVATGLWAMDSPKINFAADLVTLVVTVAAGFTLVVPLGALGAALAMLAGTSVGCIVRVIRLHRALADDKRSNEATLIEGASVTGGNEEIS